MIFLRISMMFAKSPRMIRSIYNVTFVSNFTQPFIYRIPKACIMRHMKSIWNRNSNFLNHHNLRLKLTEFLEFLDKPTMGEPFPRNSSANMLLNLDTKGTSNSYKKLLTSKECILEDTCGEWLHKACMALDTQNVPM